MCKSAPVSLETNGERPLVSSTQDRRTAFRQLCVQQHKVYWCNDAGQIAITCSRWA
jgi:hypothetical protein